MCPFDLLHFAPIALIAASVVFLKKSSFSVFGSLAIAALSLIGLVAGAHMHTHAAHAMPMLAFDPCYGYAVSLVASVSNLAFKGFKSLSLSK